MNISKSNQLFCGALTILKDAVQLPDDSRFQRWKYVELAQYIHKLDRIIRKMDNGRPVLFYWDEIDDWINNNGDVGVYTSVFHYDNQDLTKATRLGNLYFDFDHEEKPTIAISEAILLCERLLNSLPSEGLRIYFTGCKGVHVEYEAVTMGIAPSNSLPNIFRFIASSLSNELSLSTIDFQVYDLRRMWRVPKTRHQKTNLYKIELTYKELCQYNFETIKELAKHPRNLKSSQQVFNAKANEWYRGWIYKYELSLRSHTDLHQHFIKNGAETTIRDISDEQLIFNPGLYQQCPAVSKLKHKAEQEHNLAHEERLFLCSLLSYSDDAIQELHEILSNCSDYNPAKTDAHIKDWIKRRELNIGGRPFTCRKANEWGVGCGDCDLEPKLKYQRVGDQLVSTGQYSDPSPVRFAYYKEEKLKQLTTKDFLLEDRSGE